jgi:hypothetical protein
VVVVCLVVALVEEEDINMANTFKFGNENWAVKDGKVLAYNDENNAFKPLPFTFARSSSATRVDNEGLIKTTDSGFARIDFLNNTSGHLLLEPQSTNKVTQSETFSTWNAAQSIKTSVNLTAPDGSNSVVKLSSSNTNNAEHKLRFYTDTTSAIDSIFAKMGEVRYIFNRRKTQGTSFQSVVFDLQEGVVAANNYSTNAYPKITYYGNGWYRCQVYYENVTANETGWGLSDGTNHLYNPPNTTDGLYIWGAQQEDLSFATSYIPTTSSTVTRAAETCNSAGNSTVFNDSEGVLYAEIAALALESSVRQLAISDGTAAEAVKILYISSTQIRIELKTVSGTDFVKDITLTTNEFNKIALQYKASNYKVFFNGSNQSVTQTSAVASGLDRINFDRGDGGDDFYGKIKNIQVYNTALTDAELIELTS